MKHSDLYNLYRGCLHVDVFPINHWLYNYKCKRCGRRFIILPKNNYFETNILENEELRK